jgi:hypothetical protein
MISPGNTLYESARLARETFESGSISRELLARLYSEYNPGVEIDSFLDEAARLFPTLNCGLASVYLQYILGQGEIINGNHNGHNHTFLKIKDLIVDITADQFDGPEVYVGPLRAPWSAVASQH